MPTIKNTTKKPLRVPLPAGKTLHLAPAASAEVTPKALDHPPLAKLIEDGTVEVLAGRRSSASGGGSGSKAAGPQNKQGPNTGLFQAGDR